MWPSQPYPNHSLGVVSGLENFNKFKTCLERSLGYQPHSSNKPWRGELHWVLLLVPSRCLPLQKEWFSYLPELALKDGPVSMAENGDVACPVKLTADAGLSVSGVSQDNAPNERMENPGLKSNGIRIGRLGGGGETEGISFSLNECYSFLMSLNLE